MAVASPFRSARSKGSAAEKREAVFNAADLEGDAQEGLNQKRRQAAKAIRRSEPERLAGAEAVLST